MSFNKLLLLTFVLLIAQKLSSKEKFLAADIVSPSFAHTESTPSSQWPLFDPNSLHNTHDLWIDVEGLFWQSNMGSLGYAITSKSSTSIQDGHVKEPDFEWNYGFRLGLGYKLPHDKWDLFVNYAYLRGSGHGHAGGSGRVVFPTYATNFDLISPFYASSAHAHFWLTLNMGDVELGRTCFVGKWLSIRPFLGVRGLVIAQDYNVSYHGGTIGPDKVHMDNDFWGAGIRMGADTLWGLGKGISIYGNGSISLLSGHFDAYESEKRDDVRIMSIKSNNDNVVVTADLALGLQWDYLFSKDRYHIGAKVGWEFDLFFDQNKLFNFMGSPGSIHLADDDLAFQGITLGFRLDF